MDDWKGVYGYEQRNKTELRDESDKDSDCKVSMCCTEDPEYSSSEPSNSAIVKFNNELKKLEARLQFIDNELREYDNQALSLSLNESSEGNRIFDFIEMKNSLEIIMTETVSLIEKFAKEIDKNTSGYEDLVYDFESFVGSLNVTGQIIDDNNTDVLRKSGGFPQENREERDRYYTEMLSSLTNGLDLGDDGNSDELNPEGTVSPQLHSMNVDGGNLGIE